MSDYPLTASERTILEAIGWGSGTKGFHELRQASGLTMRGARRVLNSMEARNLIAHVDQPGFPYCVTWKGKNAAALVEAA